MGGVEGEGEGEVGVGVKGEVEGVGELHVPQPSIHQTPCNRAEHK